MNNTVKIPVESVLNRMSKFVSQLSTNARYIPQSAIVYSLITNCSTMVALIKLAVDGEDILNAEAEMKVVNAAKATKEYKSQARPVYNSAEVIHIVYNGKVIFKYVDN